MGLEWGVLSVLRLLWEDSMVWSGTGEFEATQLCVVLLNVQLFIVSLILYVCF